MSNSRLSAGIPIAAVLKRLLLAGLFFLILFPIYWVFVVSVIPSSNLLSESLGWLIPRNASGQYYWSLLQTTNYVRYYFNSVVVAGITTLLTVFVAAMAGYSLARLPFRGRHVLGRIILFTYVVPPVLLLIPLFQLIVRFRLNNTYAGLILAYMTFALPFSMWLMRGFFLTLPESIEEAAWIDGTSIFGSFARVVLPLAKPGLVSAAMFTFILCWNEFLFALVFINNDAMRTIPVGVVSRFLTTVMVPSDWSHIMAASILGALPVYALFVVLQNHLVQGLATGSVKQ